GWINKKRKFSALGYNIKGRTVTLKEKYNGEINSNCNSSKKQNKRKIKEVKKYAVTHNMQYAYNWLAFDLFNLECGNMRMKLNKIAAETNVTDKSIKDMNGVSAEADKVKYIDLNRKVCHELITDFYESGEIYTSDDNFKEKVEDVVNIPVFNEIAAGSPILMNDEIEYSCNLPKEWVRSSKDLFILKIKGDSMVNKNINDGDHVLINKGRYPSNNDIVAVEIEGEATLKTLKIKGRKIILKPENDKYDPIILDGGQEYSILGVAVGILKNFA
ncbi:MAG: transcriptional repressor LexA, partial [Clostridium sp.]